MVSSQRALRRSIAVVLVASAALFAVGSHIERSKERGVEAGAKPSNAPHVLPDETAAQRKSEASGEPAAAAEGRAPERARVARGETHHESKSASETNVETATGSVPAERAASTESNASQSARQLSNESLGEVGKAAEAGSRESSSERRTETHHEAKLLGINPEALSLVIIAVIVSALLAVALWWRRTGMALIAIAGFGLVFAALDVREVLHQIDESRTSLIVIASVLIGLHLLAATLSGTALLAGRIRPRPRSS